MGWLFRCRRCWNGPSGRQTATRAGAFQCASRLKRPWLPVLKQAVGFTAEDDGRTVFTGLVDDFAVKLDRRGALAEVSGRSMAAALMDNQVRAAEFVSAQLADILRLYVKPYGITRIDAAPMGQVANFAVETATPAGRS